ncbi:MAG: ATP-binding protein [Treponemataceae bacterium]
MITRDLEHEVAGSLKEVPVVALVGSRQTGKTTLAKAIAARKAPNEVVYLDLELDSDREAFANTERFLDRLKDKLVIIDEVQRMPSLFPLIRALVDRHRKNGRFLLLGSASPTLIKGSAESLAGRIRYYELPPFTIPEVPVAEIEKLWLRGGYPESFLAQSDAQAYRWRHDFLSTYLERDIPNFGIRIPAQQLRRCWTMLAHQQAQLLNASQYGNSLGISAPTVRRYLDTFADTFMIRYLEPYHVNVGKRLVKSPKAFVRDSGLLHALLGISTFEQLLSHPVVGASWEGFIAETIIRNAHPGWQIFFYRTSAGAEMDLVLSSPTGELIGIEIKFSLSPKPTRGFFIAAQDLKTSKNYVLYPGLHAYPLNDTTEIMPIGDFIDVLRE